MSDEATSFALDRFPASQRLDLSYGTGPSLVRALIAAALGGALGCVALSLLDRKLGILGGQIGWSLFDASPTGATFAVVIPGAIVALALFFGLRALRQPGGATVTWDDWGIIEWDGPRVRTAMPWTSAAYASVDVIERRAGTRRGGAKAGRMIVLADERNERIVITTGRASSRGMETWRTHAAEDAVARLETEARRRGVPALTSPPAVAIPGPRRALPFEVIAFAAQIGILAGLFMEGRDRDPRDGALFVLCAAVVGAIGLVGALVEVVRVHAYGRDRAKQSAPVGYRESARFDPRTLEAGGRSARARVRALAIVLEIVARGALLALLVVVGLLAV